MSTEVPVRQRVTTTLRTERMPDGSWSTQMIVTGLVSEREADAALQHMQKLFCSAEIRGNQ